MATREEIAAFPVRSTRARERRAAGGLLTGTQRLLFTLALVTFGLASIYTSIALLSRVTPALFPGKSLLEGFNSLPLGNLVAKLPVTTPDDQSSFNRRINLLILGIDQRPDGAALEPSNTDTIMVASIDPASKQMSLLSIPRDMWVTITNPDGTTDQNRINASWATGVLQGKTADAGAKQLETDLKNNFGISIDYWMLLDFRSAESLFNDVGGVDVTIPQELAVPSWFYSDDDIHGQWLSFPPGPVHLDGYHAVAFGRYRSTDSDLTRVKRQQLVLTAAMSKVLSLGLLNNPISLWDDYNSLVKTDIPRGKMPGYALLIKDANANVRTYSFGDPVNGVDTVSNWVTPGGADVLTWNPVNIEYWLGQAFSKSIYVGSHVELRAADGSTDNASEIALGHYFEFKGLSDVALGPNDPPRPDTHIQVIGADSGRQELANDIANWLGLPSSGIEVVPRTDSTQPDVIVDVGQDFKLPTE
ncbi:MAG: LCP family protein [Tepidiformaceae bacterium]